MRLGGQTVTVINGTQTGTDRMNSPIFTETSTVVHGCSLQEHSSRREVTQTDVFFGRYKLFTPPTAPLTSGGSQVVDGATLAIEPSKFVIDGGDFIIDGEPAVWKSKNGEPHHIECYVRLQGG